MNPYYNKDYEERLESERSYKLCKQCKNIEDIFNLGLPTQVRINGQKVYNDWSKKYGTEEIKKRLLVELKDVEFEYVGNFTNRRIFDFKKER